MKSCLLKRVFILVVMLGAMRGFAQEPARTFAYDVVSVKVNNSGSNGTSTNTTYEHFNTTNATFKHLLEIAYGIREDLIYGIPGKIDSMRFDVAAKILEPDQNAWSTMTREQKRAVLQPVLADRFKLKVHFETKTLPVYELRVLPGGAKFKLTSAENAQSGSSMNESGHNNSIELTAKNTTMDFLAKDLANTLQRTVLDKTGLSGQYDFVLKWYEDRGGDVPADAAPGIFTAVQEQLGLKLVPAKGPVETLVVDHVEMPSAN